MCNIKLWFQKQILNVNGNPFRPNTHHRSYRSERVARSRVVCSVLGLPTEPVFQELQLLRKPALRLFCRTFGGIFGASRWTTALFSFFVFTGPVGFLSRQRVWLFAGAVTVGLGSRFKKRHWWCFGAAERSSSPWSLPFHCWWRRRRSWRCWTDLGERRCLYFSAHTRRAFRQNPWAAVQKQIWRIRDVRSGRFVVRFWICCDIRRISGSDKSERHSSATACSRTGRSIEFSRSVSQLGDVDHPATARAVLSVRFLEGTVACAGRAAVLTVGAWTQIRTGILRTGPIVARLEPAETSGTVNCRQPRYRGAVVVMNQLPVRAHVRPGSPLEMLQICLWLLLSGFIAAVRLEVQFARREAKRFIGVQKLVTGGLQGLRRTACWSCVGVGYDCGRGCAVALSWAVEQTVEVWIGL